MGMQQPTRFNITINRHHTASLSDAEARTLLANAAAVLTTDDGGNDVSCNVAFDLQGSVTTFTTGDGSVDSRAEYQAVRATGGRVHIVNDINWCGGDEPNSAPNAIGCSDTPGECMVLQLLGNTAAENAVLFAHEFGHNQGLDDTSNPARETAVMFWIIGGDHRRVTQAECTTYRGDVNALRKREDDPPPSLMDIRDFARSRFIHGIPYEAASAYPADVVPILLDMLQDPQEETYRANVAIILGMIGDPRALEPLLGLVYSGDGRLSDAEYKARKSAVRGLGYLLRKTDSPEAMDLLSQGLAPGFWSERVAWRSPAHITEEDSGTQLVKAAIWGLAVSGRPEAAEALKSLRQTPDVSLLAATPEATRERLAAVAEEALAAHAAIADRG